MLQRITQAAADLADLLGIEGKILLRLLSRSAGFVALLLVLCLVGAAALLGLIAAAVVALTPQMGVAGALALMSALLLIFCGLAGLTAWSLLLNVHKQEKLDRAEQRLAAERAAAIAKLRNPEPEASPPSPLSFLAGMDFSKIDPTLVIAGVGAAAAVVGPIRLLKLVGSLAGNVALINSIISAGKSAVQHTATNGATPNGHAPTAAPGSTRVG